MIITTLGAKAAPKWNIVGDLLFHFDRIRFTVDLHSGRSMKKQVAAGGGQAAGMVAIDAYGTVMPSSRMNGSRRLPLSWDLFG